MPQHNKQRSAHLSQLESIDNLQYSYDYCYCGVCGELTFDYDHFMYSDDHRLFCPSCWRAEGREPPIETYYKYEIIGFILLDTESKFPHQQQKVFKFGKWKEIFPENYTAQYVVLYDRYGMELYLFPLKKNGYWIESKDLIRMETIFFYDKFDQVCEIACRVSRLDHWKIALECKKMKDSKLFKKEKKQFMANQDFELSTRYIFNNDDDELSLEDEEELEDEAEDDKDEEEVDEELEEEEEDKEEGEFIDFTFPITERLALRYTYAKQIESQTFQGFMINELRWYLIESGCETKQIYPIVYPLANESLDTSFELKRNWKNFNNSLTKIDSCLSGDLNGGYSDKIIYQLGKNGNSISENDIMKYSPSAIPISNFEYIPFMTSTRPFHSNPDLFQIYLIFSNIEKRSNLESNKKIGLLFSFQFKIVEEFKLLKERLFERLTRNILTDCKFEFQ